MHAPGYTGRQRSGLTLTLIVVAHAAALVALALAKIHVTPDPPATPIETWNVPIKPPPPPEPDPTIEPRRAQSPSVVTTIEPIVPTPSKNPVIAPTPTDDVIFPPVSEGPTTILPPARPAPDPVDPPARAEPRPVPVRLKPRGNPASWVTNDDYPAAALRAEEQGRTAFSLTVGSDGKPAACTVTASSGSGALDGTACRLLMRRARFVPGSDGDGNAVGGIYRNSFSWQIPED